MLLSKNKIKIIHIPVLHVMIVGAIEVDHLVCNAGIASVSKVEDYVDITKACCVMVIRFEFSLLSRC